MHGGDMAQAILALSDRVTADSPRDTLSPPALALHFPGGSIGLQSTVSVGADATNQVVLEDRYVSRFHCRLVPHGGRWVLKDLSSTNVTYLDGARVAEAEIDTGARNRVGSAELRVHRGRRRNAVPRRDRRSAHAAPGQAAARAGSGRGEARGRPEAAPHRRAGGLRHAS